jgi:hypothetical protein
MTLLATSTGAALATEPVAPVSFEDAGRLMELELRLAGGLTAQEVAVTQVFTRFRGVVVDEGARLAGGLPVRRALAVNDLGGGRVRVSLAPVPAGQALPDGVYAQFLEIEAQPRALTMEPFMVLHPIYLEVVGGVARRLDMPTYSARVEPTVRGLDKLGRAVQVQPGSRGAAALAPIGDALDVQVERGDAFAVPGDERNEN